MDNDDATVGRIFTRREALQVAARTGLGLAAIGGIYKLGCASPLLDNQPKVNLVASPVLTEGPFFVDERRMFPSHRVSRQRLRQSAVT